MKRSTIVQVPSFAAKYVIPAFDGCVDSAANLAVALEPSQRWDMVDLMVYQRVDKPAFREFFASVWISLNLRERMPLTRSEVIKFFKYADFSKPTHLPKTFRIYRGTCGISAKKAAKGFSWTTDINIAKFFANRFANCSPIIISTEILIDDVYLYTNDRKENEIVILHPVTSYIEHEVAI
jgi:hypothetical protein